MNKNIDILEMVVGMTIFGVLIVLGVLGYMIS